VRLAKPDLGIFKGKGRRFVNTTVALKVGKAILTYKKRYGLNQGEGTTQERRRGKLA